MDYKLNHLPTWKKVTTSTTIPEDTLITVVAPSFKSFHNPLGIFTGFLNGNSFNTSAFSERSESFKEYTFSKDKINMFIQLELSQETSRFSNKNSETPTRQNNKTEEEEIADKFLESLFSGFIPEPKIKSYNKDETASKTENNDNLESFLNSIVNTSLKKDEPKQRIDSSRSKSSNTPNSSFLDILEEILKELEEEEKTKQDLKDPRHPLYKNYGL